MNSLYQFKSLATGELIPVMVHEVTIGRDTTSDIVIDDPELSRAHVRLEFSDNVLTVEDLQSTNGTYVNEEQVIGSAELKGGDTLRIGGQTLLVIIGDQGGQQTLLGSVVQPVASFVLEKNSTEGTAIRKTFPPPPGWSSGDRQGLEWLEDAEQEQLLSEQLKKHKAHARHAAGALLVTTGDVRKLLLLPAQSSHGQWIVGRDENSHVPLDDLTVSSRHAMLTLESDQWTIQDLESRNGVLVNGVRQSKSELQSGDKLRCGQVEILFRAL